MKKKKKLIFRVQNSKNFYIFASQLNFCFRHIAAQKKVKRFENEKLLPKS